ncbi:MAG TPA: GNAT family N-acetyltransferase [Kouleothrix sp.]|uniref:GNAT family N-acetyltransferase n=1 Tax=Kouleothrix sp. TaxID=2779161 RepID=UPI002CB97B80|nr:GNAT family N-acetyltransferase [Kouleothrix sp.]HRC75983.1 GNAT family N-acetyltransferase [Kouleothrix sp.]
MNHIIIQEASEADIPAIVAITQAAFAEYSDRLDPPSSVRDETAEKVLAKLAEGRAVLALVGGAPAGTVYYSPREGYVYLGRLAVLPERRGQGVGAALIAYVERRAAELGLPLVRLGVRVALPHLRAMYERLGYRVYEERRHPGYAVTTFVMMEKDIL